VTKARGRKRPVIQNSWDPAFGRAAELIGEWFQPRWTRKLAPTPIWYGNSSLPERCQTQDVVVRRLETAGCGFS